MYELDLCSHTSYDLSNFSKATGLRPKLLQGLSSTLQQWKCDKEYLKEAYLACDGDIKHLTFYFKYSPETILYIKDTLTEADFDKIKIYLENISKYNRLQGYISLRLPKQESDLAGLFKERAEIIGNLEKIQWDHTIPGLDSMKQNKEV
jgi:hypothetical protein